MHRRASSGNILFSMVARKSYYYAQEWHIRQHSRQSMEANFTSQTKKRLSILSKNLGELRVGGKTSLFRQEVRKHPHPSSLL
jgi:hypothetical protein